MAISVICSREAPLESTGTALGIERHGPVNYVISFYFRDERCPSENESHESLAHSPFVHSEFVD
jgi:hypothetical protein